MPLIRSLQRAFLPLAFLLLPAMAAAQNGGDLLQVTDAFKLSARIAQPGTVQLHWDIAPHYYLYRGRIKVKALTPNAQTGALQLPDGLKEHDPYLGDVEIYHDRLDASLPYSFSDPAPQTLQLAVTFQGCHEIDPKICYPPATQKIELLLSSAASASAITQAAPPPPPSAASGGLAAALARMRGADNRSIDLPVSNGAAVADVDTSESVASKLAPTRSVSAVDQSYEQKLAGLIGGHGFAAIALFFGFGVLLAFTPCVLPMIPILTGLIAGSGQRLSAPRAFALSLVYVLASCVVFTIAGVVAGLAGANLAAWMQKPAILISFALLFVLLALSMFGLYSLQLPSSWQTRLANVSNRQRSGSFIGVAAMGVLSALIVGPCVAPPLAAAVLYIGQRHDPVFGGLALFALSLGMGVPLLVIGTAAGRFLPRAGMWMDVVKAFFGVVFLGLAIWMLSRILAPVWILALTGALLIGCAVFLGALSRAPSSGSRWRRIGQALGLIAMVIGACELVGAAAGSRDLLAPLSGAFGGTHMHAQTQALAFRPVKSVEDVHHAVAAAAAAGQPAMLDFYADWCVSCKEMDALTFSKPQVQRALAGFVLLRADVTANDDADQALLKRYGLFGPPATLFFDRRGNELNAQRLIGYEDSDAFLARAKKVREPLGKSP
ncbi:MAG: protein-disulfide reductase DsbD [Rhodanobacteraceae bacterium]